MTPAAPAAAVLFRRDQNRGEYADPLASPQLAVAVVVALVGGAIIARS
jgi:hypothetical protein